MRLTQVEGARADHAIVARRGALQQGAGACEFVKLHAAPVTKCTDSHSAPQYRAVPFP